MNIIIDSIGSVTGDTHFGGTPMVLYRVIYFQLITSQLTLSGELKSCNNDVSFSSAEQEVKDYLAKVVNQIRE